MKALWRQWGKTVRYYRTSVYGLSQVALANRIGVSQTTLSEWERGQSAPSDLHRIQLAKEFRVPVPVLFPYPVEIEPVEVAS